MNAAKLELHTNGQDILAATILGNSCDASTKTQAPCILPVSA